MRRSFWRRVLVLPTIGYLGFVGLPAKADPLTELESFSMQFAVATDVWVHPDALFVTLGDKAVAMLEQESKKRTKRQMRILQSAAFSYRAFSELGEGYLDGKVASPSAAAISLAQELKRARYCFAQENGVSQKDVIGTFLNIFNQVVDTKEQKDQYLVISDLTASKASQVKFTASECAKYQESSNPVEAKSEVALPHFWQKQREEARLVYRKACKGDATAIKATKEKIEQGHPVYLNATGWLRKNCASFNYITSSQSAQYQKQAADLGYPIAMANYGRRLIVDLSDDGVSQDARRGVRMVNAAIGKGYSEAAVSMAQYFLDGKYLERDVSKAREYLRIAEAAGIKSPTLEKLRKQAPKVDTEEDKVRAILNELGQPIYVAKGAENQTLDFQTLLTLKLYSRLLDAQSFNVLYSHAHTMRAIASYGNLPESQKDRQYLRTTYALSEELWRAEGCAKASMIQADRKSSPEKYMQNAIEELIFNMFKNAEVKEGFGKAWRKPGRIPEISSFVCERYQTGSIPDVPIKYKGLTIGVQPGTR